MAQDESVPVDSLIQVSKLKFQLTLPDELSKNKAQAKAQMLDIIAQNKMGPFYSSCDGVLGGLDVGRLAEMTKQNEDDLKAIEERIHDAEENLGETEIREAHLAKAQFFGRIGDKEKAVSAYRVAYEKTVPVGQRLDIVFDQIRIGFAFHDADLVSRNIEKAKSLVEEGGDWERRNRLKIYEAVHWMSVREFKKAGDLLLSAIATFSCYEVMSFAEFVKYTVLLSLVSFERTVIRSKVLYAPEVLAVIDEVPFLSQFMNSLYNCQYKDFFTALPEIHDLVLSDSYLRPHAHFYTREMRIRGYAQFLESYRSVSTESMGKIFGVGLPFLDKELSRFIASGRLHCKIDKVAGIVETNRPDSKNALYQQAIKQGDALLNRVSKLSKVMDL